MSRNLLWTLAGNCCPDAGDVVVPTETHSHEAQRDKCAASTTSRAQLHPPSSPNCAHDTSGCAGNHMTKTTAVTDRNTASDSPEFGRAHS